MVSIRRADGRRDGNRALTVGLDPHISVAGRRNDAPPTEGSAMTQDFARSVDYYTRLEQCPRDRA